MVAVGISGAGCAHVEEPDPLTGPEGPFAQLARLRHENATLRKKVQNLEERVRLYESDGDAADTMAADSPSSRHLPVVKLAPPREHEEPASEYQRQAVTLSPMPQPTPYEPEPQPTWTPAPEPEPQAAPTPASGGVKSYRLVGSRLVELTKRPKPKPQPRSKPRTRRAKKKQKANGVVDKYDAAMATYKEGRFQEAEDAFSRIVNAYPSHDYADNALYWKGEAAYDQAHYANALAAFTEVVERYGGGNKAPDALLKIGLCYGKLGDVANARDVLTQLIAAYPKARATQIAQTKLAEL